MFYTKRSHIWWKRTEIKLWFRKGLVFETKLQKIKLMRHYKWNKQGQYEYEINILDTEYKKPVWFGHINNEGDGRRKFQTRYAPKERKESDVLINRRTILKDCGSRRIISRYCVIVEKSGDWERWSNVYTDTYVINVYAL